MNQTKFVAIGKELLKVQNGRVYIESEELANAIQDNNINLFLDEEANIITPFMNCAICSCD